MRLIFGILFAALVGTQALSGEFYCRVLAKVDTRRNGQEDFFVRYFAIRRNRFGTGSMLSLFAIMATKTQKLVGAHLPRTKNE